MLLKAHLASEMYNSFYCSILFACHIFLIIFVDFLEKAGIMDIRMDTKKVTQLACGKLHSELAGKRTVVGAKQLRKALAKDRARQVFLARNADPAVTEPIQALCEVNHVPYTWVCTMQDLGRACGIEVGAAAAAAAMAQATPTSP